MEDEKEAKTLGLDPVDEVGNGEFDRLVETLQEEQGHQCPDGIHLLLLLLLLFNL
jgi:hypothetical protein